MPRTFFLDSDWRSPRSRLPIVVTIPLRRSLWQRARASAAALWQRWTAPRAVGLHELDTRTLKDIGLDRSEISSVIAEWRGRSSATRRTLAAQFRPTATRL